MPVIVDIEYIPKSWQAMPLSSNVQSVLNTTWVDASDVSQNSWDSAQIVKLGGAVFVLDSFDFPQPIIVMVSNNAAIFNVFILTLLVAVYTPLSATHIITVAQILLFVIH